MDNRFFPLPFSFDVEKLKADLALCEAQHWALHFNPNDYAGDWTGISLRSTSGAATDIKTIALNGFQDTPLLQQCGYFRQVLDSLHFEKEAVRLLALAPGSTIKEHRDRGLSYENGLFRLHIPITTDEKVDFVVDGTRLQMEAGQLWYANFDLPHSVHHRGEKRRIHLVIDGLRNAWTDEVFEKSGFDFELEKRQHAYDDKTKALIIEQLRKMDTDTARALILSLARE